MPFPWLGRFGAANAGRSGRRRNRRAQKRSQGEVSAPQEDIQTITQRRQRKIGLGIGSALILTVIGVVLLGYYQEFYSPPRVWAGSVSNVAFTMGDQTRIWRCDNGGSTASAHP